MAITSSKMLTSIAESRCPCLVPDHREESFSFLH